MAKPWSKPTERYTYLNIKTTFCVCVSFVNLSFYVLRRSRSSTRNANALTWWRGTPVKWHGRYCIGKFFAKGTSMWLFTCSVDAIICCIVDVSIVKVKKKKRPKRRPEGHKNSNELLLVRLLLIFWPKEIWNQRWERLNGILLLSMYYVSPYYPI